MNKKGQTMGELGLILTVFIVAIVGVVLFQTVAQEAVKGTQQSTYNTSLGDDAITFPANGARIDLTGQEVFGTPVLINATGAVVVAAGNYTIDEIVSLATGVKTVSLLADAAEFSGDSVNISYTYGADGYIDSSGARSMATIIPIFFALAIALLVLVPTLRSKLLEQMGK